MARCCLLPMCGGLMRAPARFSDQAVQSSHHEPRCLLLAARQPSASTPLSSAASYQAFGPGGLTMPAIWPPLEST